MQVGQKVFLRPIGGRTRDAKDAVITRVGRKYFEVGRLKFLIENKLEVSECGPNWMVYLDEQELKDEQEMLDIGRELGILFGSYGRPKLTLDQLRRIKAIVYETTK
ncbi:hypothetical protein ACP26L_15610 [Paenibacillus sp. S-38]|uniref:beta barrel domain-containing protein n=1 Tax=Paenibacillus sp. S-38 TaxID=3416710 RepID=UPI003CE81718